MKITYPQIDAADVQAGDTVLSHWSTKDASGSVYYEFRVEDPENLEQDTDLAIYYLIDRPKPVFPEAYGTLIIAKKVRGIEFPEGVVLTRQRGGYSSSYQGPAWKSLGIKIGGADNHGERQIEDWVLAKVVPA